MRVFLYATAMLLALMCSTGAQKRFGPLDDEDIAFLLGALDGEYLLVGQSPALIRLTPAM